MLELARFGGRFGCGQNPDRGGRVDKRLHSSRVDAVHVDILFILVELHGCDKSIATVEEEAALQWRLVRDED